MAANLYERQGDASTYTDIPKLVAELVSKVSDEQVYADLDASLAWAARNGGDPARVAVTGFCWGGRLTWMYAAHNPAVKAGVAWYGKLSVGHGPLISATRWTWRKTCAPRSWACTAAATPAFRWPTSTG